MALARWNRAAAATVLGALTVSLAGCSFDFNIGSEAAVNSDELAEEVSANMEQEFGQAPEDVSCPDDLPAEVDASVSCELTADGRTYDVTVTTTAVEGTDVEYEALVEEEITS